MEASNGHQTPQIWDEWKTFTIVVPQVEAQSHTSHGDNVGIVLKVVSG